VSLEVPVKGVAAQLPSYPAQLSSRLRINRDAPVSVQNTMVDPEA